MLPMPATFTHLEGERSVGGYLTWLARRKPVNFLLALVLTTTSMSSLAIMPYLIGHAVDEAIAHGFSTRIWWLSALMLAVGLVGAAAISLGHYCTVKVWMYAAFPAMDHVCAHATTVGSALTKDTSEGEIVATVATDADNAGSLLEQLPLLFGSLLVFVGVAIAMLKSSLTLGLFVLVGLPAVTLVVSLVVAPLERRHGAQRESVGKLTALSTDTVTGLRILRGIGGEDEFARRYRKQSQQVREKSIHVANLLSFMSALRALLPALFVTGMIWLGARAAIRGEISAGELVTFYGYTAYLARPLRQIIQVLQLATRARVAARRILSVLAIRPAAGTLDERHHPPATAALALPAGTDLLVDEITGVSIDAGKLTAIVAPNPDEAAAILTAFARLDDTHSAGKRLAGKPLVAYPLAALRETIVFVAGRAQIFSGTLKEQFPGASEAAIHAALQVADGGDVLQSVRGPDGEIGEGGLSLSGGQRQRLALARAVVRDAPIMLAIDPTSAVDSHTELRIATRLAKRRRGLTTVLTTASPLVLSQCDEVIFVADGAVQTRGAHLALLAAAASGDHAALRYRQVVQRATAKEGGRQ